MQQRLQDRIAVITGAGSGIGLASVRRLAAEGALVVAVDIDEEAGKAAAARGGVVLVAVPVHAVSAAVRPSAAAAASTRCRAGKRRCGIVAVLSASSLSWRS